MRSLPLILILLTGCATDAHYLAQMRQLEVYREVEVARAQASARKYDAITAAATGGSDLARVVSALAAAGLSNTQQFSTPLPPVTDPNETALKWASIILPSATAITAGYFGYRLGAIASDNAAATSIAGYNTMGGIASAGFAAIQAPQPNITTTTSTTSSSANTLSGTGVLGSGSFAIRNCNGGIAGNGTPGNPLATGGNC